MLAHSVFFSLHDQAPAARDALVADCRKYLAHHPGVQFFAAGLLADEFVRPVNDRQFDVALHVVFRDKAAHDAYQQSPEHLEFIDRNKPHWKAVRVFDAYVES